MTDPKPDEIISHPPMGQLQGLEYCIGSNPPWGEAVLLGFQHYILSLGTAVMIPTLLAPLMGGDDVRAQNLLRYLFALSVLGPVLVFMAPASTF